MGGRGGNKLKWVASLGTSIAVLAVVVAAASSYSSAVVRLDQLEQKEESLHEKVDYLTYAVTKIAVSLGVEIDPPPLTSH